MTPSRSFLPLVAIAFVVLTAGCVGFFGGADDPATDLQQEIAESKPPETVSATVETSVTEETDGGPETETTTEKVWLRDDDTSRTESVGNGTDNESEYVVIDDGEQVWHQDREANSITHYEATSSNQTRLERIYEEHQRYFERFDVESVDEASVGGREAHRIVFEPPQNETLERSIDVMVDETTYRIPLETSLEDAEDEHAETIEIWFDEETHFPLAYEMEADTATFSVTYEDVSFDDDVDEALFEFEPPIGAEPEELQFPAIDYYDSADAVDAAVDFDVSEPDPETIPDGFELDSVQGTTYPDEERTQTTLFYRADGDRSIQVAVSDAPREFPVEGAPTSVGDVDATIGESEMGTELEWEHEGHHYHLFGDEELEAETLLEIAESLHE